MTIHETAPAASGPGSPAIGAVAGQILPNAKWIRGLIGRSTVVDSRDALFVWEFPYYPHWYFPLTALQADLRPTTETKTSDVFGTATVYDLVLQDGSVIPGGAWRYEKSPAEAIRDRIRVRWDAVDTWLEEEVEVFVHPRSPFTRVDVLPSTRRVTVSVDGTVVADSERSKILYETGLPPRYYLPLEDIDQGFLRSTDTSTACPYKGVAHYWDVTVGGVVHQDLLWGYRDPLPESAAIKNLACFYNEKVGLEIDGIPVDQPTTKFS